MLQTNNWIYCSIVCDIWMIKKKVHEHDDYVVFELLPVTVFEYRKKLDSLWLKPVRMGLFQFKIFFKMSTYILETMHFNLIEIV